MSHRQLTKLFIILFSGQVFVKVLLHLEAPASTHLFHGYFENLERQAWHLCDEDIFITLML